jgi:uncharacterized protein (TIGR02246 family)
MQDARNAILVNNEKFMADFKQGDAAGVAALYTADARLLPPNSQMIIGVKGIQEFWQGAMSLGIKEAKLETIDVETRDDLAIEVGRYTLRIEPAGGNSQIDSGKYVVVWKNDNGRWKLHIDIWNTSISIS